MKTRRGRLPVQTGHSHWSLVNSLLHFQCRACQSNAPISVCTTCLSGDGGVGVGGGRKEGSVQYVTKDVNWNHTSNVVSTRYVRWPAPGCRAATGSWDLRVFFNFFFIGAARLGGTAAGGNQIRGEEVSGVGQTEAVSRRDSCLPNTSQLNIPPTWKRRTLTAGACVS